MQEALKPFSPDRLAPGLRRMLRLLALFPGLERMPPSLGRWLMDISAVSSNPWRNKGLIQTDHRLADRPEIRLREWTPASLSKARPIVMYIHGGGWVLGSSKSHRSYCEMMAKECNCSVFSVDYRRAPEHPFPGPLHDVEKAWHWLEELRKERGWQNQPMVVAGDSAGGNLATVLCRRLRDSQVPLPDAQFLVYPVTDFAQNTESYANYGTGLILNRPLIDWFFRLYKGALPIDHPDLSPLRCQDLTGLPPTFISLAGYDMLLDEGRAYADRLEAAGVAVTLKIFPDMIHAFINLLAIPEAHAAALETIRPLKEFFKKFQSV